MGRQGVWNKFRKVFGAYCDGSPARVRGVSVYVCVVIPFVILCTSLYLSLEVGRASRNNSRSKANTGVFSFSTFSRCFCLLVCRRARFGRPFPPVTFRVEFSYSRNFRCPLLHQRRVCEPNLRPAYDTRSSWCKNECFEGHPPNHRAGRPAIISCGVLKTNTFRWHRDSSSFRCVVCLL